MSRIEATFRRLRRNRGKALIAYLTAGYPSVSALPRLVDALVKGGADLLELGVPFSDPLADGPTIQAASERALSLGVTPQRVLRLVKQLRHRGVTLPIVLMTYANPVFRYGVGRFCSACRLSGVDGLIVPDLPPEEAKELIAAARSCKVDTIFLAAPTSTPERLRKILHACRGFLYYVSLTGVTGARRRLPSQVVADVPRLRRRTALPVCVGFGVSTPAQVQQVARAADGVVVGSALLNVIGHAKRDAPQAAYRFVKRLKAGLLRAANN